MARSTHRGAGADGAVVADLAVGVVAAGARGAGGRAREVAALLAAAALGVRLALVVAALQRRALVARQAGAGGHQVDDVTAGVAAAGGGRAQLLCNTKAPRPALPPVTPAGLLPFSPPLPSQCRPMRVGLMESPLTESHVRPQYEPLGMNW